MSRFTFQQIRPGEKSSVMPLEEITDVSVKSGRDHWEGERSELSVSFCDALFRSPNVTSDDDDEQDDVGRMPRADDVSIKRQTAMPPLESS